MLKRIGLIGDVHARDERLEAALGVLVEQELDAIICTGDIMDGPGCPERCMELLKAHNVHTVRGNHDGWVLEEKARHLPDAHLAKHLSEESLDYLRSLPAQLEFETVQGRLMLCHGIANNDLRKVWPGTERMPPERSHELDRLITDGKHHFIINGHMHFKVLIHFKQLTLINAGTLAGNHRPGFTTIDFENNSIQAYMFDGDVPSKSKTTSLSRDEVQDVFETTACFEGNWEPRLLFER